MVTFDSIEGVEEAYERLILIQRTIRKQLFGRDDIDWDSIEERLEQQSSIMESIESAEALDEEFQRSRPEVFQSLMEELNELREEINKEVSERKDELEKQLESLDQSESLLNEYDQTGESSYHLDETI